MSDLSSGNDQNKTLRLRARLPKRCEPQRIPIVTPSQKIASQNRAGLAAGDTRTSIPIVDHGLQTPAQAPSLSTSVTQRPVAKRVRPRQIHRQKVLAMQLAHTRLCSPARAQRLAAAGIITCEDICRADLQAVAGTFRGKSRALATLKLYRRSIRLAASVDGLVPIDAMALVSIHRRTVSSLATQSAAMLHRDLTRFAESSPGQALLRGRRMPSTKRIRKWIEFAKLVTLASVHPQRSTGTQRSTEMPRNAGMNRSGEIQVSGGMIGASAEMRIAS